MNIPGRWRLILPIIIIELLNIHLHFILADWWCNTYVWIVIDPNTYVFFRESTLLDFV